MPSARKSDSRRSQTDGDRVERKARRERRSKKKTAKRSKKDEVVVEHPIEVVYDKQLKKSTPQLDETGAKDSQSPSAAADHGLPKRLNVDESDLDPTDFDARIERCRQRITEGVAVKFFQVRLEGLKAAKKERMQMISSEPKGLPWEVIMRLKSLRRIEHYLHQDGDSFEELPNVWSIMTAYRSGLLQWFPDNRVTYWSKGKPLGPPAPFDWNVYMKLSAENEGHKGFWVEGNQAPRPKPMAFMSRIVPPYNIPLLDCNDHRNELRAVVRLAGLGGHRHAAYEFDFLDDSGASHMLMYKDDLFLLNGTPAEYRYDYPWQHIHGFEEFLLANDETFTTLIATVEVKVHQGNINQPGGQTVLLDWTLIQCAFNLEKTSENASGGGRPRLAGPFLRQLLYTATAPDGRDNLYLSTHKEGLMDNDVLPAVTIGPRSRSPHWFIPSKAAGQKMPYSRWEPHPTPFTATEPVPLDRLDEGALQAGETPPVLSDYNLDVAPAYVHAPSYQSLFGDQPPPDQ